MKKSLFMLGAAIVALSSCSNNELVEVAENRAIHFGAVVNNHTRAVTEVTQLATDFFVFGNYSSDKGTTFNGQAHNNEPASNTYFWNADVPYRFGAYADGANGQLTNVAFDAAKSTLTFTNYTPNDAKDLVAAISGDETRTANALAGGAIDKVALTFKHMLSQVQFTFNTTNADNVTIKISNIKVNAMINNATCTYTTGASTSIAWTGGSNGDYIFTDIADVADQANNFTAATDYKLVIPQNNQNLKVTFTAEISGGGLAQAITKNLEASLAYAAPAAADGTTSNQWTPGYRYNYIATIDGDVIAGLKPIEFNPTVEAWKNASDTTTTPTTPAP